jgi:endonuclease III-like uncharacterized protein
MAARKPMRLPLPYFTFGLDSVLLVGRLHLGQHQTVDEVHKELLERLRPLGVSISRREILYLFEAYCTLLRESLEAKDDQQWLDEVNKHGGIIVSVDGIQPEKGNETVYVVRDALSGRVLAAENVTSSETEVIKARLSPVVALVGERKVKVLGTITDAEVCELLAVQQLWPEVPHQMCQFHVLRDAGQQAYAADKKVKTAMREPLQPKVRASGVAAQKLARLKAILAERAAWADQLAQIKRMHRWVLEVDHLLEGTWAQEGEVVSNVTVGRRLDGWREHMAKRKKTRHALPT